MDLFMCVAIDRTSFEEIRIDDYIRAYSTTGRPPAVLPADAAARTRAGLPALFQPLPEPPAPPTGLPVLLQPLPGPPTAPTAPTTRDPAALPAAHGFTPTTIDSDTFHTLTAMPLYRFFSLEELRAYAYLRGNKHPPTPIDLVPFVVDPSPPTHTAFTTTTIGTAADPQCTDHLLTISTEPQYSSHSLEELRIAYMHAGAGRDVTSAEIFARASAAAPAAAAPAPVFAPTARGPAKPPFGAAAYPFAPAYRG